MSRHHCALRAGGRGLELRDLGSRNGTFVGELELVSGYVGAGVQIRIGKTMIRCPGGRRAGGRGLAAGTMVARARAVPAGPA